MNRIILHIDLDYFYAQIEELRKPELKGQAVAVCMFSGRTEYSGAIATSNYKARELGIKSGMPITLAKQKVPELILIKADREYYETVSERIMEIFREHTDKFEQVSIDEAYLDVTKQANSNFVEARKTAETIKEQLKKEEQLTCSIGIGPNKLIAKMASSTQKPNGLTIVTLREVNDFLRGKRISDLHGIGPKTLESLTEKGIKTIPKLAETPIHVLQELFGENKGILFHEKALGIDESPVEERERQQYSRITTLKENTSSPEKLFEESRELATKLAKKVSEKKVYFKTISIILISDKLETISRSKTIERLSQKESEILEVSKELFRQFFTENPDFVARRFGLRISNFFEPQNQKSLLDF